MPIEFTKISSFVLENLPRDKSVFFFPVGPLEDHGPHLPLGLDLQEAHFLCTLTAKYLEEQTPGWHGIIMPQAPLGIESNTTRIAITVRPHVLRDWLVDATQSLVRLGFSHFVCYSGHIGPRQLTAIEEAGLIIRKQNRRKRWRSKLMGFKTHYPTLISARSAFIPLKDVLKSPFWPDPIEHGGKRDTSVALALNEKEVKPLYKTLSNFPQNSSRWMRNLNRRRNRMTGYWGNPSGAEAALGEQELLKIITRLFPKLKAVWDGANPNSIFRSWYSILPPNKSFFKAWILVACIICLMATWILLNSSLNFI